MNALDYAVLFGTLLSIALYGMWRTRGARDLSSYLRGDAHTGWATIGLSVMATQASAITFLSTPGQGYESGLGFVQNYFGMPIALILVAAVFVPLYRRLGVYTAYEFLGRRFDTKTRVLGALLFLVQRGLAAGITIYAPAIIVSTVLGWSLDWTVLLTGALVIVYTVMGGSGAVTLTQKHQMAVILAGMAVAFFILLSKLPSGLGLGEALHVAGAMDRLQAIDFSLDPDRRYTIWSGLLGGLFLSLSYFGTDQSQVQRYLAGGSVRDSRLGLMFNAVLKIPMQFFILLLGAFVFVFYQFERPPVFFNEAAWARQSAGEAGASLRAIEERHGALHAEKSAAIEAWLAARRAEDTALEQTTRAAMLEAQRRSDSLRQEAREVLVAADPRIKTKDSDYVFITFVMDYLPHGVIGLLLTVIFAAALSSAASELNALGTTTAMDLYRGVMRPGEDEAHYVRAAKWFTAGWGAIAVGAALVLRFAENLIEMINIVGSLFYGVVLGLFLVAFFLRRIGGAAVFIAAILAQGLVLTGFFTLEIGYLWYNLIGCTLCVVFSLILHGILGGRDHAEELPKP
jgi:solute:Na+ symporter, SSS family